MAEKTQCTESNSFKSKLTAEISPILLFQALDTFSIVLPLRINYLHYLPVIYSYITHDQMANTLSSIMTSLHYIYCPSKERSNT